MILYLQNTDDRAVHLAYENKNVSVEVPPEWWLCINTENGDFQIVPRHPGGV